MSVELPIHEHGLTFLRDVSQNCIFECSVCDLPVKGCPAYFCYPCGEVYHKSCADPAPLIHRRHPFHPAHTLVLRKEPTSGGNCSLCGLPRAFSNYCYECEIDVCGVWIHRVCAAATAALPFSEDGQEKEEEKEDVIQHFAHPEHPLKYFVMNEPNNLICKLCSTKISGRVYGCLSCAFILHESCARLPIELQGHPFHPHHHHLVLQATLDDDFLDCKACLENSCFAYYCKECDFFLGLHCATSVLHTPSAGQNFEDSELEAYRHISHPHSLISLQATKDLLIFCEICKDNIFGDFFCCPDCRFMLHKSCANSELSGEIVLPFHPEHPFILPSPDDHSMLHKSCFLCSKFNIRLDLPELKCKECPTSAHITCSAELLYGVREPIIQNIHIHPHQMVRTHVFEYNCSCCFRKITDLCYVCCEEGCKYLAHIECATAKSTLEHPFHLQHPLIFHEKPPRESAPCNACLMPFIEDSDEREKQIAYCCDVCELQVHARCAMQNLRVKHPRHEHDLTYFESVKPEQLLCNICFEICVIDLYRCVQCNYNLHYCCMYLPPTVKHKDHIHPMVLRDRFILSHLRLDDQYCDLCETIRDPDHGVYYCDICECAAHIDCVIPKHEAGQSKLSEDLMILNLDKEIESEYTKKEELMANMEKLKEKLEATMNKLESLENRRRQIMSSRKQEEASLGKE